jgi:hypothetical protein
MPCLETNFAKQPVRSSLLSCSLVNLCLFPGPSPSPRPLLLLPRAALFFISKQASPVAKLMAGAAALPALVAAHPAFALVRRERR